MTRFWQTLESHPYMFSGLFLLAVGVVCGVACGTFLYLIAGK